MFTSLIAPFAFIGYHFTNRDPMVVFLVMVVTLTFSPMSLLGLIMLLANKPLKSEKYFAITSAIVNSILFLLIAGSLYLGYRA